MTQEEGKKQTSLIPIDEYAIKVIKMNNIHKEKQIEHLRNEKAIMNLISKVPGMVQTNYFPKCFATFND